jgi:TRAP-type C4-dicarboxylate transport system substrate-binding protein
VQNKLVINARNGADVSQQVATLEELERTVGAAMLPLNQTTTEYQALIQGGANAQELDSLLIEGFDLDQVISYYTGQ